ncbi:CBS domain-containing protein [Sphingomonas qomolangmaensis]|uniref:CBS domain-containing protein n=1 Tax=Sphingomonas qomolangmaensis TaxID=2918765 RepID=A0ABY5L5V5_9SPHN|nr:CBS domain-containing protein [Sphingomonas qomolangmaensis]UUL82333.1 CBS domain-containing protein [Sphingomonas qomolangmaensis]
MTIAAILAGKGYEVIGIAGDQTATQAVALLAERRIGAVPVVADGQAVGVFSERDVVYALEREGKAALDRSVTELMTTPVVSVDPRETVIGALALMTRRRIRHLPVVENGRLVGFVSIGDLVKYRIDRIEAEAEAMRSYIQQV